MKKATPVATNTRSSMALSFFESDSIFMPAYEFERRSPPGSYRRCIKTTQYSRPIGCLGRVLASNPRLPTAWLIAFNVFDSICYIVLGRCDYPAELAQLLDVDMDQLAGMFALVAAHRLGRFQHFELVQAKPFEDTAYRDRRDADLGRDRLAGHPLTAQSFDPFDHRLRCWPIEPMRPRTAVGKAGSSPRKLKSRNLIFFGRNRMDNLSKAHS
jgi:hypothetical protein